MDYETDFKSRYLSTPHGKIHYMVHNGEGSSLIMLHGLAANTKTWTRLVQYLPESLDLYMVDLLGHGLSDAPKIRYTIAVQLSILKELIAQNKINGHFVFGHSYGGWIAAAYAKDNSAMGIILEDSSGLRIFYDNVKHSGHREAQKKEILEKAKMLNLDTYVAKSIVYDESAEEELVKEDLQRIKSKTLIIWGGDDKAIGPSYARIFNKFISDSELEIIESAKHTPHYTNPRKVSELLLRFINSNS